MHTCFDLDRHFIPYIISCSHHTSIIGKGKGGSPDQVSVPVAAPVVVEAPVAVGKGASSSYGKVKGGMYGSKVKGSGGRSGKGKGRKKTKNSFVSLLFDEVVVP